MKQLERLAVIFIKILSLFIIQKPLFLLSTKGAAIEPVGNVWSEMPAVIWHGLTLDSTMAGYICAIPCLLLLCSVWVRKDILRKLLNAYMWIPAFLIPASFILNAALYPYWNFPLDTTPLFYFFSSPADAFASTSWWMPFFGIVLIGVLTFLSWKYLRIKESDKNFTGVVAHRCYTSLALVLCCGLLFVAIRGGVTVSTANSGKVYYSQNIYLNHAAVNPLFSLMESFANQDDFANQYRFMDAKEADKLFAGMHSVADDDTAPLLKEEVVREGKPDILFIIMESFASDLFSTLGGTQKDVVPELDSIASRSILFTNFYANSFRTDRGIVSVLSGYPAQPTTSIMKNTDKSASLPSIVRSLTKARGYSSSYYYGGDVDFAHQRSYLVSQGYQNIISDADFPVKDKLSKWGVPDHIVAERLLADLRASKGGPWFRVFQTSSSHEPFDVPYKRLKNKRLNAFAYTDSVVGNLLRQYSRLPGWNNTLIVIVPDHVGGYKKHLDNFSVSRYQIPLILAGGAIAGPMRIDVLGTQHDIAATLLGQLHVRHDDFRFSKNLLSTKTPKFAFFTVPDAFGMITGDGAVIYDNKQQKAVYKKGDGSMVLQKGKAYLQKLYDDLAER